MKKVFGTLSFLSFFYMFGVGGAIEQDMIALGAGFLRMVIGLVCWWLFAWLAGAFDDTYAYDEDEEAAEGSSSSHDGKRKAHSHYSGSGRKNRYGRRY